MSEVETRDKIVAEALELRDTDSRAARVFALGVVSAIVDGAIIDLEIMGDAESAVDRLRFAQRVYRAATGRESHPESLASWSSEVAEQLVADGHGLTPGAPLAGEAS